MQLVSTRDHSVSRDDKYLLGSSEWFETFLKKFQENNSEVSTATIDREIVQIISKELETDNVLSRIKFVREETQKYLAKRVVLSFLEELKRFNVQTKTLKIAFDFYGPGVLAWIELKDNDTRTESVLSKIESSVSKEYKLYDLEFALVTFEESDQFPFPPNYAK